jgi:predicted secreted protein
MAVGERAELQLPGLGTAGYRWESRLSGDGEAVSLRWHRGDRDALPRRAGQSAPERLEITALAPGRVVVHLAQRRPWETGPPRSEHRVEIHVR